ncbi:MAG TPA: hypothetical protein VMA75_03405 [Candidatus Paceibacterota bacterium]|nr:hypothetical protein [Candidatus Paceibacterota bacterium]
MKKLLNRKYIAFACMVTVTIVAIGCIFLWRYHFSPVQSRTSTMALPEIQTPSGWYLWGKDHLPAGTNGPVNNITFGNKPMASADDAATMIVVNAQDPFGRTDEQWIADVLSSSLEELGSPTSTRLWSAINGRLVLRAVTQTPAGGYDLNYYILNDGVEYIFQLDPTHADDNISSSSDAQTLHTMVQNFAESLPPIVSQ